MANSFITLLLVLNSFVFYQNSGTENEFTQKTKLLENYPNSLHFQSKIIRDLEGTQKNQKVSINSLEKLGFQGTVVQNITWNENAQTISIQLDSFPPDTRFLINKINKDGKTIYKANILNLKFTDAYQLTGYGDAEFTFSKVSTENIVTP